MPCDLMQFNADVGWRRLFALAFTLSCFFFVPLTALQARTVNQQVNISDFEIAFSVDLERDNGDSLGTVFEVQDQAGKILAGAGFERSFNTKAGSNHRLVTFYTRRQGEPELVDLGRPFQEYTNVRLFSYGGRLIAYPYEAAGQPLQYSFERKLWEAIDLPPLMTEAWGYIAAIQNVGGSLLVFHAHGVTFDARAVGIDQLQPGDEILTGLFHAGRLHIFKINSRDRSAAHLFCAWSAGAATAACRAEPMPSGRANPYVINGLKGGGIIAAFDNGDTLVLNGDGKTSRPIFSNSRSGGAALTSWQLYSALEVRNGIVFGHYPSGNLLVYRDGALTPIEPAVPSAPETLASAREAQTLAIFRGEIVIGMWPWGELWAGQPGARWRRLLRVFGKPDYSRKEAPYADLVKRTHPDLPFNSLGQRIFHFASHAEGLALSTSGKHHRLIKAYASLDPLERAQYGRVFLLRAPDQITCGLARPWPQSIRFQSKNGWLRIIGDRGTICERRMEGGSPLIGSGRLVPLDGIWGPASPAHIRAAD